MTNIFITTATIVLLLIQSCTKKYPCDAEPKSMGQTLYFSIVNTNEIDIFLNDYKIDSLKVETNNSKAIPFKHSKKYPGSIEEIQVPVIVEKDDFNKALEGDTITNYYYLKLEFDNTDTLKITYSGKKTGDCNGTDFAFFNIFYNNKKYATEYTSNNIYFTK